jgi:transcriptional regulator
MLGARFQQISVSYSHATDFSVRSTLFTCEEAGITRGELARHLKTRKTAISRIENHAEDIKLSTLERVAGALGKRLQINIA